MSMVSAVAVLMLAAGGNVAPAKPRQAPPRPEVTVDMTAPTASLATLRTIVAKAATEHGLSPRLLGAIITVESGWNPWAVHYETTYRYVLNVAYHAHDNHITLETERHLQHTAFGLTQLVGGTARAISYTGSLTRLLDPATNAHWGARYLRTLKTRYPNSIRDQISAFNCGSVRKDARGRYSNQAYVDRVTAVLTQRHPGGGLPH